MREAADQRLAVQRLELVELAAVDQPRDDLAHVVGPPQVAGAEAVEFFRIVVRLGRRPSNGPRRLGPGERREDAACEGERMGIGSIGRVSETEGVYLSSFIQ